MVISSDRINVLPKAFDAEHTPVVEAGAAIDSRYGTVSYNAAVGFHF